MSPPCRNSSRKKTDRRVWNLEEQGYIYKAVLDGFPDAIIIIDHNFTVLYMNAVAEKRTGYGISKQEGEKCFGAFYNRVDPCPFCPAARTFKEGNPCYALHRDIRLLNNRPCFEELWSFPVKQEGKGVKWVVEIEKDVTQQKELEQQLINSQRLISLGEMAASIAHEFNNPLGIILGFAQDMLTEVDPSEPAYASLRIIEEESRRCKKIMQGLMEFCRPAPARLQLTRIEEVIHKSVDLVSGQLQKGKISVKLEIQRDLPGIWADPQQIQQVLLNLYFNAIEAMPEGGTLTVEGRLLDALQRRNSRRDTGKKGEVVISVSDTGQGIKPDDMPKIFSTFFTTKPKKGMGLGLSICKRIIEAHRGRIRVESTPGIGAIFYLYLPLERRRRKRYESISS